MRDAINEKRGDLTRSVLTKTIVNENSGESQLHFCPKEMPVSIELLRSAIPRVVTRSTGRGRPLWGQEGKQPEWWPSGIPFLNPKQDFRDVSQKQTPWIDVLREILTAYIQWMEGWYWILNL